MTPVDQALEGQIKTLIVETLLLEHLEPCEIGSEQPLFGEGLGLDSVDALELAMEIERRFEVPIPEGDESRSLFRDVRSLAKHIFQHRAQV